MNINVVGFILNTNSISHIKEMKIDCNIIDNKIKTINGIKKLKLNTKKKQIKYNKLLPKMFKGTNPFKGETALDTSRNCFLLNFNFLELQKK